MNYVHIYFALSALVTIGMLALIHSSPKNECEESFEREARKDGF
jgi:hypothetical protein